MLVAIALFSFRGGAVGAFCAHFVKHFDLVNEEDTSLNVYVFSKEECWIFGP